MAEEPEGEPDAPEAVPSGEDEHPPARDEPQDPESETELADADGDAELSDGATVEDDGESEPTDASESDSEAKLTDDTAETDDDGGLRKVDDGPENAPPPDVEPPPERTRSGQDDPDDVEEQWQEFYQRSPATPDSEDQIGGLGPGGVPAPDPEAHPDVESEESPGESDVDGGDLAAEIADEGPMETDLEGGEMSTANPTPAPDADTAAAPTPSPSLSPESGEATWDDPAHPPDDEEMPLADHIEEMVWRFGFVVVFGAVVTALSYPFSEDIVLAIWDGVLPVGEAPDPYLYGPLEKITTQIKVASLAGILAALPMLVYQSYRFMRPGLYPHERRYYLAAVPTSLVFAAVGMAFSYLVVLPALFLYFWYYTADTAVVAFGLRKTFDLIVTLTGFLAVIFQIPLFIMLAIMLGVTTRDWLADKRLYFWGGFVLVAGLFAPDPTGMAPIIVAITEVVLFEGTLLLLKWVDRD